MDESVVHELAKKAGGRFHLTALVQKRLIELNRGEKPAVEPKETQLRTVIEELLQGKLDASRPALESMQDDSLLTPAPDAEQTES